MLRLTACRPSVIRVSRCRSYCSFPEADCVNFHAPWTGIVIEPRVAVFFLCMTGRNYDLDDEGEEERDTDDV